MNHINLKDSPQLALSFVRNQAHVLNSRVYEIEYPEMDYASLIPVNTDLPEWASGMDTLIGDKVGKAEWQSGYTKDIPMADVTLDMVTSTFAMYSVGYQWNIEEIGKAMFQNFPLRERRASSARFASEVFVWEVALIGASLKGWTGLINNQYVTPAALPADGTAAPLTAWVLNSGVGNKTPEQIVRDVNRLIAGPPSPDGILTSVLADTVLLPPLALDYIDSTPYGVTSPGLSISMYIERNNVYTRRTGQPLTIRELPALSTAATVGVVGGGRAMAYRNNMDVLELPMPMPYNFLPVYQDGPLNFAIPGIGRVGQVDVKKPAAIRYGDGVTDVPPAP